VKLDLEEKPGRSKSPIWNRPIRHSLHTHQRPKRSHPAGRPPLLSSRPISPYNGFGYKAGNRLD
jgi:hypothetical protein